MDKLEFVLTPSCFIDKHSPVGMDSYAIKRLQYVCLENVQGRAQTR